jgi:FkbM family methyltransferase
MAQFVTYAQNFEDLMLHRALRNVREGFYIDVGANLPHAESVTKAFYDRGWHGINVEPTECTYAALVEQRPRDTNLPVALWNEAGERTLFLVADSEAFATLNPHWAQQHRDAGRTVTEAHIVTETLASICERYVDAPEIHFLKIDVEGGEFEVLEGGDFTRWRPWIILGEAHGPDFFVNHYQPWEDLLLDEGYVFAYTDGLNRFYIASERFEALRPAFAVPPNVCDNWIRGTEVAALARAEHAETIGHGVTLELERVRAELEECTQRAHDREDRRSSWFRRSSRRAR